MTNTVKCYLPKSLLALLFLSCILIGTAALAQDVNDHAIIQRRRLVLVRSPATVKSFPYKKTATVTYPVISGLTVPVQQRVRALLEFKNIFDYSLKEYREDTWLDEFKYVVNYNANSLLYIKLNKSGSGAYPDDQSKHFLINLKNGTVIKASDAFVAEQLPALTAKIDRMLKTGLKGILKELADSKSDPEDIRIAREAQEPLEFATENLNDFSVNAKGVTFLYDAGYPHAIRAFQPVGQYFFTYAELKSFIKKDGPLGVFVR
jgi:hypothetical protein